MTSRKVIMTSPFGSIRAFEPPLQELLDVLAMGLLHRGGGDRFFCNPLKVNIGLFLLVGCFLSSALVLESVNGFE